MASPPPGLNLSQSICAAHKQKSYHPRNPTLSLWQAETGSICKSYFITGRQDINFFDHFNDVHKGTTDTLHKSYLSSSSSSISSVSSYRRHRRQHMIQFDDLHEGFLAIVTIKPVLIPAIKTLQQLIMAEIMV